MKEVHQLADYPLIKKLAASLWKQDANSHGAAIMIGAGFSRCSARHVDGGAKLPLWHDFSRKLKEEMGEDSHDLAFSDPLRLAEEYRAYCGQTALNDLIRNEINDSTWQPGTLHQSLLGLPWADVLTTNWDTLLERAATQVHHRIYNIVSKQSDLAYSSSPRITKLHGTIGITEDFIVAEEDYRKYPIKHAAFVNFTRQVFIENELCLLGFSGDDPNFLQWAGWVRDNLAHHSRRIYLVGALNLSAAKRKHLESINIAPIDLWGLVESIDDNDLKHKKATDKFLQILNKLKPKQLYNWKPTSLRSKEETSTDHNRLHKDHEYAASVLEKQLDLLKNDRETYPC